MQIREQRFQSKLHFPLSAPYRLLLVAARRYAQCAKISAPQQHARCPEERTRETEGGRGEGLGEGGEEGLVKGL